MAISITLANLIVPLKADTSEFARGMEGSIQTATSWAEKIKSAVIDKGISLIVDGARLAAQKIGELGMALAQLVIDAAPLEGIGIAFEAMAGRVGLSLDEMRQAAAGTVSDFELMRKANIALTGAGDQLGVAMGESLPRLMEIARASARATGQSADFMFESLVSGIKRSSPMLIDNTGLVLRLGEANAALAVELGKSVEDLTAEEKQIALLNATVLGGQQMIDAFGGGTLTAAERLAQFRATVQNTKDQIGLALLPVLNAIMEPLGRIAAVIGPKVVALFEDLGPIIGDLVNWFVIAVEDGDTLNDFLANLPEPFRKVEEALRPFIELFQPLIDGIRAAFGGDKEALASGFAETLRNLLGDEMVSNIETFLATGQELAAFLADLFETKGPAIMERFQEIWDTVWPGIQETTDKVVSWFEENLPLIQETAEIMLDFWVEHVAPVIDNVWGIIVETVGGAIDLVLGIIKLVMQIITGDWEGAWETIKETAAGIWERVKALFSEFLEGVLNAIGTTTDEFVETWRNNLEMLREIASAIWERITTAVSDFVTGIGDKIAEARDTLAGIWEEISAKATEIWEGIVAAVTEKVEEVRTAVTTKIEEILAGITGFIQDFIDAGAAIIEGLKEGVLAKVGELIGAVTGSIEDALAAAKDLLQIACPDPSPVTAELGQAMSEGMAMGVRQTAHLPATAMALTTAGAIGAAGDTITNFEMNINARTVSPGDVVQGFEMMRGMVGA